MTDYTRKEEDDALILRITANDFVDALWTINRLVPLIEKHQHHPDVCIHDYRQIEISLTTHDEGNTITQKDKDLADAIQKFLEQGDAAAN